METINKEKIKNKENIKKGLFDKVTSFFEQLKNKHSGIEIIEQEIKKTSDEVNSEVEEATVNNLKSKLINYFYNLKVKMLSYQL